MDGHRATYNIFDEVGKYFGSWQDVLSEFPNLFEQTTSDYTWTATPEPKQGCIDAGLVFTDRIVVSTKDFVSASEEEIGILQKLLTDMANVEYWDDSVQGKIHIRAGIPRITTLGG